MSPAHLISRVLTIFSLHQTGLISVTDSLFVVVESYERLSPDPGERTVFLLNQLSQ